LDSKSRLFKNYNAARSLGLDRGRLNKALGIAQSKAAPRYGATADFCRCRDAKYRPWVICKHRIAAALVAA
jgi:hypothetical protein